LSSSSRKVLVADGDEIVVALISHILHRQGYLVDVALSFSEAVQCLQLKIHDAIVIDSKLFPALDRFPDRRARTIVLGGNGEAAAAHAVLPKPVEFGSLVETVAGCVK